MELRKALGSSNTLKTLGILLAFTAMTRQSIAQNIGQENEKTSVKIEQNNLQDTINLVNTPEMKKVKKFLDNFPWLTVEELEQIQEKREQAKKNIMIEKKT